MATQFPHGNALPYITWKDSFEDDKTSLTSIYRHIIFIQYEVIPAVAVQL